MSTWYLPTSIPTNSFSDSTMAPFPPRDPPAFPTLRIRASSPSNCSGGTGGIDPATWLSLERTFVALGRNSRPGRPSAPFPTSSSRYKVEGVARGRGAGAAIPRQIPRPSPCPRTSAAGSGGYGFARVQERPCFDVDRIALRRVVRGAPGEHDGAFGLAAAMGDSRLPQEGLR